MWIWWIISLIVLIACFIFAYRMIVSSYDFLPTDKKFPLDFRKDSSGKNPTLAQQELIRSLKTKLQTVEDNSSFYEIQFSKFQQRLKMLEEQYNSNLQQSAHQPKEEEEDWKEMYFEENELKEKLENELDEANQKLEEAEKKLSSIEANNSQWAMLQSEYDTRLNDMQSMQDNISLMQRQLVAAAEREKELEQILLSEITIKKKYAQLESSHLSLQSENEDLRKQLVVITQKERDLESRVARLNELESKLAIYEEEKAKMISDLESMLTQNKMFSGEKNS
ncbi:MAG: hypothetical protein Q8891_02585 [Bacteroidota bacterium]|nr:hypothetical protein [Bacteroidota bacterium]